MDRRLKSLLFAILAGICASTSGTFGKIGMGVDKFFGFDYYQRPGLTFLLWILMVVMVVSTNIGVWLMYTRSLRFGSTLFATCTSIASNYIFTALTGVILFSESCSFLCACGTLSVIFGVMLMSI